MTIQMKITISPTIFANLKLKNMETVQKALMSQSSIIEKKYLLSTDHGLDFPNFNNRVYLI